jgi:hypothetical protein
MWRREARNRCFISFGAIGKGTAAPFFEGLLMGALVRCDQLWRRYSDIWRA